MINEFTIENYFSDKLSYVINKSFELKSLDRNRYLTNNDAVSLVVDCFNGKTDVEKHVVNTFKYRLKKIHRPVFENKISIGEFIFGISISVIIALNKKEDKCSIHFFNKIPDKLFRILNLDGERILSITDLKELENFITGIVTVESLTMDADVLQMHKRVYLNALSLTSRKSIKSDYFRPNLYVNIIRSYENELHQETQKRIKNSVMEYENTYNEEYHEENSYDYDNVTNNPLYDDNLDMDQQSQEFWDNL